MEQVARTYQERNSFRSTGRIFGVSHVSVQKWLKKSTLISRIVFHLKRTKKWARKLVRLLILSD